MTYLELVQALYAETTLPGSPPTAVTGQIGDKADICRWIAQAWTDIQLDQGGDWRWLRRAFTLTTTPSQSTYAYDAVTDVDAAAPISRFSRWVLDDEYAPSKIYLQSAGIAAQRYVNFLPWEWFQQIYRIGANNTQEGPPVHVTIDHQDRLQLGYTPDAAYVYTGEFYRGPQTLAADGDVPEMPSRFHMAIVYRAMRKHGYRIVAPEVLERAREEYSNLIHALISSQLPRWRASEPMA